MSQHVYNKLNKNSPRKRQVIKSSSCDTERLNQHAKEIQHLKECVDHTAHILKDMKTKLDNLEEENILLRNTLANQLDFNTEQITKQNHELEELKESNNKSLEFQIDTGDLASEICKKLNPLDYMPPIPEDVEIKKPINTPIHRRNSSTSIGRRPAVRAPPVRRTNSFAAAQKRKIDNVPPQPKKFLKRKSNLSPIMN